MMKKSLLIMVMSILSLSLFSQVWLQNNSEHPVDVAIATQKKNSSTWVSEGWWHVEPGDKKKIHIAYQIKKDIYFRVEATDDSGAVWIGNSKVDHFIVSSKPFEIRKRQFFSDENPTWSWEEFGYRNIGNLRIHTIYIR